MRAPVVGYAVSNNAGSLDNAADIEEDSFVGNSDGTTDGNADGSSGGNVDDYNAVRYFIFLQLPTLDRLPPVTVEFKTDTEKNSVILNF